MKCDMEKRKEDLKNAKEIVAEFEKRLNCHKLHSACISTTSRPIFTN